MVQHRLLQLEIPKENKSFRRQGKVPQRYGLVQIEPRIHLSKSLKFLRKTNDSRGPGGVPTRNGLVQIEHRIDLSMGTEILEIP